MASSPRTGRSPVASFGVAALIVGAILVIGVVLAFATGTDLTSTGQHAIQSLFPPIAVTEQGERIRDLYTIVFLIGAVIFFLVEGLIIWTVVRYRRKPSDVDLPVQTHGNAIAEVVWTVVPTIIVAFLFLISWQTLNAVDTVAARPDVKIRAVAGQFQWSFDYLPADWQPGSKKEPLYSEFVPTGADGGLHVPTGRTVQLYLTSNDVIHAFYVPQFLFKRDVVPGRTNSFEFNVKDSDAGQTFRGQCAELCGSGHRIMLFEVHALTGAKFDTWLAEAIAAKPSPPPAASAGASGQPAGSAAAGGNGPTLVVSAANVAFEQATLQAPANTPFKIDFENKDSGTPHNIAIKDAAGSEAFKGEIFPGPAKKTYDVPALAAGSYSFVCTVHPNMTGTLTVN